MDASALRWLGVTAADMGSTPTDVGWEAVWEGMTNTGVDMQSTESQEMGPEDQGVGADGKKVQRT